MMDSIFSGFVDFFSVLLSFFPLADINFTQQLSDFTESFRQGLAFVDPFLPVATLMWAMGLILTIEIAILSFKTWRWIAQNVSLGNLG